MFILPVTALYIRLFLYSSISCISDSILEIAVSIKLVSFSIYSTIHFCSFNLGKKTVIFFKSCLFSFG